MKAYIRTNTDDLSGVGGFEGYDSIGSGDHQCAVIADVTHIEQFNDGGVHFYVSGGGVETLSFGQIMALLDHDGGVTADVTVTDGEIPAEFLDADDRFERSGGGHIGRFRGAAGVKLAEDGVVVSYPDDREAFIPRAVIRAGGPDERFAVA